MYEGYKEILVEKFRENIQQQLTKEQTSLGGRQSSQCVLDGYLIVWIFPMENRQPSSVKSINSHTFNDFNAYLMGT